MGSASAHRVGSERVRLTVAELLGRYGTDQDASGRPPVIDTVPEGWATPSGPPRWRLAFAAVSMAAAGSLVCTAALSGGPPQGGALGSETTEGGHPVMVPVVPPPAEVAEPKRESITPVVRAAQVSRTPARVAHAVTPAERRRTERDSGPVPSRGNVRAPAASAPAGSALSSLTPVIGPVDALLHALG